jgi:hypothetical protein
LLVEIHPARQEITLLAAGVVLVLLVEVLQTQAAQEETVALAFLPVSLAQQPITAVAVVAVQVMWERLVLVAWAAAVMVECLI